MLATARGHDKILKRCAINPLLADRIIRVLSTDHFTQDGKILPIEVHSITGSI